MKIHGQGFVNGTRIISAYKKAEKTAPKAGQATDSIELSDLGKKIAQLQKMTSELPDVSTDLVLKLKQQIATNSYQVPAEKLADKLYEEIVKSGK